MEENSSNDKCETDGESDTDKTTEEREKSKLFFGPRGCALFIFDSAGTTRKRQVTINKIREKGRRVDGITKKLGKRSAGHQPKIIIINNNNNNRKKSLVFSFVLSFSLIY